MKSKNKNKNPNHIKYPWPNMTRCFMKREKFKAIAHGHKKVILAKPKHERHPGDFMQVVEVNENGDPTDYDIIVCIDHIDKYDDDPKIKRLRKNCQALSITILKTFKRV